MRYTANALSGKAVLQAIAESYLEETEGFGGNLELREVLEFGNNHPRKNPCLSIEL